MTGINTERKIKTWAIVVITCTIGFVLATFRYNSYTTAAVSSGAVIQWNSPVRVQAENILRGGNAKDTTQAQPNKQRATNSTISKDVEKKKMDTLDKQADTNASQSTIGNNNDIEPHNKAPQYIQSTSPFCKTMHIESRECEDLETKEKYEPQMFPIQFLSGAPGSGNDWLLWLASVSKYTWPRQEQQMECSYYGKVVHYKNWKKVVDKQMNCLFFKSHEPWGMDLAANIFVVKATLLLRHPFDAAFSEYKRLLVQKSRAQDSNLKTSAAGLNIHKIYDSVDDSLTTGFMKYIHQFFERWLDHITFWLTEYNRPLRVLLYNSAKQNTTSEIESMQQFFGYNFDGANIRRHCCVMVYSLNPALKRRESSVDQYKDKVFEKIQELNRTQSIDEMLSIAHNLLDKRFPGSHYRILRG